MHLREAKHGCGKCQSKQVKPTAHNEVTRPGHARLARVLRTSGQDVAPQPTSPSLQSVVYNKEFLLHFQRPHPTPNPKNPSKTSLQEQRPIES